jgi:hypothetical protein
MAGGLLAEVAGDFFGALVPEDDALFAIHQVDADREAFRGRCDKSSIKGVYGQLGASDLQGDAAMRA